LQLSWQMYDAPYHMRLPLTAATKRQSELALQEVFVRPLQLLMHEFDAASHLQPWLAGAAPQSAALSNLAEHVWPHVMVLESNWQLASAAHWAALEPTKAQGVLHCVPCHSQLGLEWHDDASAM